MLCRLQVCSPNGLSHYHCVCKRVFRLVYQAKIHALECDVIKTVRTYSRALMSLCMEKTKTPEADVVEDEEDEDEEEDNFEDEMEDESEAEEDTTSNRTSGTKKQDGNKQSKTTSPQKTKKPAARKKAQEMRKEVMSEQAQETCEDDKIEQTQKIRKDTKIKQPQKMGEYAKVEQTKETSKDADVGDDKVAHTCDKVQIVQKKRVTFSEVQDECSQVMNKQIRVEGYSDPEDNEVNLLSTEGIPPPESDEEMISSSKSLRDPPSWNMLDDPEVIAKTVIPKDKPVQSLISPEQKECPLCTSCVLPENKKNKKNPLGRHLEYHRKYSIVFGEHRHLLCKLNCCNQKRSHYHCGCGKVIRMLSRAKLHIGECKWNREKPESEKISSNNVEHNSENLKVMSTEQTGDSTIIKIETTSQKTGKKSRSTQLEENAEKYVPEFGIPSIIPQNLSSSVLIQGRSFKEGCPLCPKGKVNPRRAPDLRKHMMRFHDKHSILFGSYKYTICRLQCGRPSQRSHYHCVCGKTIRTRVMARLHIRNCAGQKDAAAKEQAELLYIQEEISRDALSQEHGYNAVKYVPPPEENLPTVLAAGVSAADLLSPDLPGSGVTCPLCPTFKVHPGRVERIRNHLIKYHDRKSFTYGEYKYLPCRHGCRNRRFSHFHCRCRRLIHGSIGFRKHLPKCPFRDLNSAEVAAALDDDRCPYLQIGSKLSILPRGESATALVNDVSGRLGCPLCPETRIKPRQVGHIRKHLQRYHDKLSISVGAHRFIVCRLPCKRMTRAHFHCTCGKILVSQWGRIHIKKCVQSEGMIISPEDEMALAISNVQALAENPMFNYDDGGDDVDDGIMMGPEVPYADVQDIQEIQEVPMVEETKPEDQGILVASMPETMTAMDSLHLLQGHISIHPAHGNASSLFPKTKRSGLCPLCKPDIIKCSKGSTVRTHMVKYHEKKGFISGVYMHAICRLTCTDQDKPHYHCLCGRKIHDINIAKKHVAQCIGLNGTIYAQVSGNGFVSYLQQINISEEVAHQFHETPEMAKEITFSRNGVALPNNISYAFMPLPTVVVDDNNENKDIMEEHTAIKAVLPKEVSASDLIQFTSGVSACPLCPEDVVKPDTAWAIRIHLRKFHDKHSYVYGEHRYFLCRLPCWEKKASHYHCICGRIMRSIAYAKQHLPVCTVARDTRIQFDVPSVQESVPMDENEKMEIAQSTIENKHSSILRSEQHCLSLMPEITKGRTMICPLCPTSKYRPTKHSSLKSHLGEFHEKHSFVVEGFKFVLCRQACTNQIRAHYHCLCGFVHRILNKARSHCEICPVLKLANEFKDSIVAKDVNSTSGDENVDSTLEKDCVYKTENGSFDKSTEITEIDKKPTVVRLASPILKYFNGHLSIIDKNLPVSSLIDKTDHKICCPLCPESKLRLCKPYIVKRHLDSFHKKHSFVVSGCRFMICRLPCLATGASHYHCLCGKLIRILFNAKSHIQDCVKKTFRSLDADVEMNESDDPSDDDDSEMNDSIINDQRTNILKLAILAKGESCTSLIQIDEGSAEYVLCPLCPSDMDQFKDLKHVKSHMVHLHDKFSLEIGGYRYVLCRRRCQNVRYSHFHCFCGRLLRGMARAKTHIHKCRTVKELPKDINGLELDSIAPDPHPKDNPAIISAQESAASLVAEKDVVQCPLCPVDLIKPRKGRMIRKHLKAIHDKHSITTQKYKYLLCRMGCRCIAAGHFHCICGKIFTSIKGAKKHYSLCAKNRGKPCEPTSVEHKLLDNMKSRLSMTFSSFSGMYGEFGTDVLQQSTAKSGVDSAAGSEVDVYENKEEAVNIFREVCGAQRDDPKCTEDSYTVVESTQTEDQETSYQVVWTSNDAGEQVLTLQDPGQIKENVDQEPKTVVYHVVERQKEQQIGTTDLETEACSASNVQIETHKDQEFVHTVMEYEEFFECNEETVPVDGQNKIQTEDGQVTYEVLAQNDIQSEEGILEQCEVQSEEAHVEVVDNGDPTTPGRIIYVVV